MMMTFLSVIIHHYRWQDLCGEWGNIAKKGLFVSVLFSLPFTHGQFVEISSLLKHENERSLFVSYSPTKKPTPIDQCPKEKKKNLDSAVHLQWIMSKNCTRKIFSIKKVHWTTFWSRKSALWWPKTLAWLLNKVDKKVWKN